MATDDRQARLRDEKLSGGVTKRDPATGYVWYEPAQSVSNAKSYGVKIHEHTRLRPFPTYAEAAAGGIQQHGAALEEKRQRQIEVAIDVLEFWHIDTTAVNERGLLELAEHLVDQIGKVT